MWVEWGGTRLNGFDPGAMMMIAAAGGRNDGPPVHKFKLRGSQRTCMEKSSHAVITK